MKIGDKWLSFEITSKRSCCDDPITQDTIEKCIRIALDALEGERDRDGNALILHSLIVGSMGQTDEEKCVGFLHDVVEDTKLTFDDLRDEEVPEKIIEALKLCTHKENMDYYDYVQRIIDSGNMTAIHVKQNDLRHNLARGHAFGYPNLIAKHQKALRMIEDYLKNKKE